MIEKHTTISDVCIYEMLEDFVACVPENVTIDIQKLKKKWRKKYKIARIKR